jgi:hypothetical protein
MRTREPHLYAIGDAVGGLMLAHTAGTKASSPRTHRRRQGHASMDYTAQPRATYCRPEIALGRAHEQQCQEKNLPYKVGKVPFQAIAKATHRRRVRGLREVIGNTGDRRHARRARHRPARDGLIAEATLAFSLEATPWEIGARDPSPPDPVRGHRRGRDGGRRPAHQLLSRRIPRRERPAMADTGTAFEHLGASVGLTDDDLIGMYASSPRRARWTNGCGS